MRVRDGAKLVPLCDPHVLLPASRSARGTTAPFTSAAQIASESPSAPIRSVSVVPSSTTRVSPFTVSSMRDCTPARVP